MDLKIITAIHNRFDMTEAFLKSAQRIRKDTGVETYAVVSEGDDCIDLLKEYQVSYIEHPNKPVGKKFNAIVKHMKKVDFTHLMILGSDDIASTKFIEHVQTLDKYDYLGISGLWFWGLNPRRAGFGVFGYFPVKVFAGAGKVISRRLVELSDWMPWPDGCGYGMDAKMMSKTRAAFRAAGVNYTAHKFDLREIGGFLVDVKYDQHISSMSPITRRPTFDVQDPYQELSKYLPEDECEYLFSLHKKMKEWWAAKKAQA